MQENFPFVLDLTQAVVGLYGGCLFAWWWFVLGRASYVYAMVMIVMFGHASQNIIGLYARHMVHADPSLCHYIAHQTWFVLRDIGTFAGIAAIIIAMTVRAVRTVHSIRSAKIIDRRGNKL